jgi:putative transcriptional regulator
MILCRLAVVMAERKLNIQDVADMTGLSRTTVSALVNGNGKGVQFDTLDTLCNKLNCNPGNILVHMPGDGK